MPAQSAKCAIYTLICFAEAEERVCAREGRGNVALESTASLSRQVQFSVATSPHQPQLLLALVCA